MAEGVEHVPGVEAVESPMPAADPSSAALVERPVRHGTSRTYRSRFALAYIALALVGGLAVGATALLVERGPKDEQASTWSSWRPTGSESSYPDQIADYVSGRYRLPSGNALVGIIAGPPWVQTEEIQLPVQAVAIQNDPEGSTDDISIVTVNDGLMYVLCGLGESCSIREGAPSADRHRLLRREALELALYTFKYTPAQSVIALLPPRVDVAQDGARTVTATALFFQKAQLEDALDRPLRQTLQSRNPPQAAEIDQQEGLVIDRLTRPRLFSYQFQQTQQGGAIIVLAPVA